MGYHTTDGLETCIHGIKVLQGTRKILEKNTNRNINATYLFIFCKRINEIITNQKCLFQTDI